MPLVYKGYVKKNSKEYDVTCILDRDVKVNLYVSESEIFTDTIKDLLSTNIMQLGSVGEKPPNLVTSYISYMEKDMSSKEFKRRTLVHGELEFVHVLLEHSFHSFSEIEVIDNFKQPTVDGVEEIITYRKETNAYKVDQTDVINNGIRTSFTVLVSTREGDSIEISLASAGKGSVKKTGGVEYKETVFEIGDVRDSAIHSQVRSIQFLKSMKDLKWIEELIESNHIRVVDTEEGVRDMVEEIRNDSKISGEKKVYYDTESTGLNVMDLPPDHPKKTMMAAHVVSWVKERREDGYPINVVSCVIPVGMKFTKNVDEIVCKDLLRPILVDGEFAIVAHNAPYEVQINYRYSEIEGGYSYNKYYRWLSSLTKVSKSEVPILEDRILALEKEKEEVNQSQVPNIIKKGKLSKIENEINEIKSKLDVQAEIERVKALPKGQKPYLSDIKGEDIYKVNIKYDTLILSRMANNGANTADGIPFMQHNLEFLTKNYLGYEQLSLDDIYGNRESSKFKIYDFSLLPEEFLKYYAGPDGWTLPYVEWHLERAVYNHMIELGYGHNEAYAANVELLSLYYNVDVPFAIHQAIYAGFKGIGIDKEKLDLERIELEAKRNAVEQFLIDITGEEDVSWTSAKQVGSLVFYKYKYPIKYRTPKDNLPSFNKATRKLHINQSKDKYDSEYEEVKPIPIMEKDLTIKSTWGDEEEEVVLLKKDIINNLKCPLSYIYQEFISYDKDLTSFIKMIYEKSFEIDGQSIFFPHYVSTSTDTGRAASGIMIMKANKKGLFRARKGHALIGGDLDQAELRLIATMAGDLEEINRFKYPRYDPHTKTAADVNNIKEYEVEKEQRDVAKVINFGIAYGMEAKAAATNIYPNLVPLPQNLIAKTAMVIKNYHRTYVERSHWLGQVKKLSVKLGYSKTPMGRYKFFPETRGQDLELWEMGRVARQGGNVPVQGCCADYIKQRIVKVFEVIEKAKVTRFFTQPLFVHDEFFCELDLNAIKNASNKVYTTEDIKNEQQFNILWLYELMYRTFTETPLGIKGLIDEAPMTMGIGLGETWKSAKSDLYGCPQELQVKLVNMYRNNEVSDELFKEICEDPIQTMLNQIRTWWAEQIKTELDKLFGSHIKFPSKLNEHFTDLFLTRNLKDIFPISPKELEQFGLESSDYFTGQCIKALKYLNNEEINIVEIHNSDKDTLDNITYIEDYLASKEEMTSYDREEIEEAFASVFKEASLMVYNRYMAFEETKSYELNIAYLNKRYVVELEKLLQELDKKGVYGVDIVYRVDGTLNPSKIIPTTYKIPLDTETLLRIKDIYDRCVEERKSIEKGMLERMKLG